GTRPRSCWRPDGCATWRRRSAIWGSSRARSPRGWLTRPPGIGNTDGCELRAAAVSGESMSLFEKAYRFTKAREVMASGYYPYFAAIEESYDTEVVIRGERKVMFGSNNYLGLTHHPKVLEAAASALHRYGSGCTGSRFLNGTLALHEELEERLARFVNQEAALVFSTGFQTNLGVISTMVGREDHVFSDKLNHASIIDGSRLSMGTVHRYPHGDLR